jgi:3-hydroxy-9,10-secoandrosta-1,3,5(10)-triene-9,17-dione monooxygenase
MTQTLTGRTTYANAGQAIDRARELAPRIRERVARAEELRRLPDETVQDLNDSGLFMLLAPRTMGGSELNYDAVVDVTAILGEACPSTGWVYALCTAHMLLIAQFPLNVQTEVFTSGNPITSSCVTTTGTPVRVQGGYRWSGRGFFSSGVDHAGWLSPSMSVPNPDGTWERRWLLMRKGEFEIVDDWFTVGLKGTGSKTVAVHDAFIPDERTVLASELSDGTTPGTRIHPGVLYQAASDFTFSLPGAMPVVGAARGFLATFQERIKTRIDGDNAVVAREALASLPRLALAAAEIDAAYAVLIHDVRKFCFAPASAFTVLDKARCRRDCAFVARTCRRAVNALYEVSGGTSLYTTSDLMRLWHDTNAAAAHHALNWDIRGNEFGRLLMGLAPTDPDSGSLL